MNPVLRLTVEDLARPEMAEAVLRLQAAALAAVADPVAVTDGSGRILWTNPAFSDQNGYGPDEVRGRRPSLLKSERTDPSVYEALWREILAGRVFRGELVNRRRDGSEYVASLTVAPVAGEGGAPVAFVSTHRDVTVQREAEARLRRSEESIRAIVEQLPDAIVLHRDGRVIYANPRALADLGRAATADLRGLPLRELVHPDDAARLTETTRSAPPGASLEVRFLRPDGTTRTAELLTLPIAFEGGQVFLSAARDVTERKALHARMMQLDRAIAVGTLAAGVAHEINNPLTFVLSNLDFAAARTGLGARGAADDPGEDAELRQLIEEARGGAARIRAIVKDLSLFSRSDRDDREPTDLPSVIDAAVGLCWNEIRHRARLVKRYGDAPKVFADPGRLAQIFVNLLVNAAQALPAGQAEAHQIEIATSTGSDGAAIAVVRDDGAGIPPEILPRIFEPFFTTKPVGQGTGLGLGICQGIVRSLGGEISVSSRPGEGASFCVSLPPAGPEARAVRAPAEPAPRLAGARLLVVDDEEVMGRIFVRLLSDHAVTVETAAAAALARIERGERYDAILCDLMMPKMGGLELHERLRAIAPEQAARMIFVTGGAFTPEAVAFLAQSENPRVDKPISEGDLAAALHTVLARRG